MRLFSRLGSWFRADALPGPGAPEELARPKPAEAAPWLEAEPVVLSGGLPATPAEAFRGSLLDALDDAYASGRAGLYRLDPTVQLLVIPPAYSGSDEERRLTDDLDNAIQKIHANGRVLSSLTWSALRDARPSFEPSYLEWGGAEPQRFEGEVGLIFFLDIESIAVAMAQAAQQLGFSTRYDPERPTVIVHDGRFEAHVGVHALVAEALWTARGPLSVVRRRARALPGEFRSFLATLGGLARRFPGVRFEVRGGAVSVSGHDVTGAINYRHLAASIRSSGLGVDRWLARVTLEDLLELDGDPALLLRSPSYLKAYPDALSAPDDDHARVAVRYVDGRAVTVRRRHGDPDDRFSHFVDEATRQLGFRHFRGHTFLIEDDSSTVTCFVGDGVGSVALYDALARGIIEHLMPPPPRGRVLCPSEDVLLVFPDGASDVLVEEARRRALALERDLFDDRADRLEYARAVDLSCTPAGHFELDLVPTTYFELCDEAARHEVASPAHAHYLRGLALETIGRLDLAAEHLERSLRKDSDDGEAHFALGRVLNALEEHARAVPFLERASESLPHRAEAQNALGLALYLSGSGRAATSAFERAVKLDPTEPAFLVNLGRCYFDEQDYKKAESALERALAIEPGSAEAHASMAMLCHRTGDARRALHHAREVLAEEPDNRAMRGLLKALGADSDE